VPGCSVTSTLDQSVVPNGILFICIISLEF
jgi:hypothetical protein